MLPEAVNEIVDVKEPVWLRVKVSNWVSRRRMRKMGLRADVIDRILTPPKDKLKALGVEESSTFYEFYSKVRFVPIGRGEELHTLDEIVKERESKFHELENPGIYNRFLQISSIEGEGSYFYEIETDRVFSAGWGELSGMVSGDLEPSWLSFYEFLEWYYS